MPPTSSTDPSNSDVTRFVQAYNAYAQRFESAWSLAEIQQRGVEAEQQYAQAMQAILQLNLQRQVVTAWKRFVKVVQDALAIPEVQECADDAYLTYLQEMKQAWAALDPAQLDPQSLLAIAHTLSGAAWLAAAVNGVAETLEETTPVFSIQKKENAS
ncbi:MAG: hypothetical protein DYG89_40685 [Caldilinea sp. CFX5]|nr:hypothetical protein [Caldilinea sp. CFX5]